MRIRQAAELDFSLTGACMRWLGAAGDRLRELMQNGSCRVLVAEEDRELIAVLGLVLHRPDGRRSGIATIRELRVHPDQNHRGIGSRLVRFAEGIARINGCRKVEVPPSLAGWGDGRCWPGLGYSEPGAGLSKVLETRIQGIPV
jgi:N-acetylglutamate synthase-like GNAT family acetyltransferase